MHFGRRDFLGALPFAFSSLTGCKTPSMPGHLFVCEQHDLRAVAVRAGLGQMYPNRIEKNSTGTQVYISQEYAGPSERKILVVPSAGPFTVLEPPALVWAIDDDLGFVAWSKDLETGLGFRTGFHQEIPKFAGVDFAPGSLYYFISPDDHTIVYATNNPGVSLASVNFIAQKIFCKKDRLYLFGFDGEYYTRRQEHKEIIGRVFRITSGALTAEADFHIPRPFAVASPFSPQDLDSWSDQLLCIDIRDEFGAKWFLYDLHSRVLTGLGKSHTYGLFLGESLISFLRSG